MSRSQLISKEAESMSNRLIIPHITTARRTAVTPALGDLVFDTDLNEVFHGVSGTPNNVWTALAVDNVPDVIPYSSSTTYSIHQLVRSGGALYVSLTNGNLGNAVTDTTNWLSIAGGTDQAPLTQAAIISALSADSIPQSYVIGLTTALSDRITSITTANLPRFVAREIDFTEVGNLSIAVDDELIPQFGVVHFNDPVGGFRVFQNIGDNSIGISSGQTPMQVLAVLMNTSNFREIPVGTDVDVSVANLQTRLGEIADNTIPASKVSGGVPTTAPSRETDLGTIANGQTLQIFPAGSRTAAITANVDSSSMDTGLQAVLTVTNVDRSLLTEDDVYVIRFGASNTLVGVWQFVTGNRDQTVAGTFTMNNVGSLIRISFTEANLNQFGDGLNIQGGGGNTVTVQANNGLTIEANGNNRELGLNYASVDTSWHPEITDYVTNSGVNLFFGASHIPRPYRYVGTTAPAANTLPLTVGSATTLLPVIDLTNSTAYPDRSLIRTAQGRFYWAETGNTRVVNVNPTHTSTTNRVVGGWRFLSTSATPNWTALPLAPATVSIRKDTTPLDTASNTIEFRGDGVQVSNNGATGIVTIEGGGVGTYSASTAYSAGDTVSAALMNSGSTYSTTGLFRKIGTTTNADTLHVNGPFFNAARWEKLNRITYFPANDMNTMFPGSVNVRPGDEYFLNGQLYRHTGSDAVVVGTGAFDPTTESNFSAITGGLDHFTILGTPSTTNNALRITGGTAAQPEATWMPAGTGGPGLTTAQVNALIANWAEEGNTDQIPANKLGNAPSGGSGSDNLVTREVQTITASGTMTSASSAANERIIFSLPSTYTTSTGGSTNRFSATWNWFGGGVTAAFDTFSIFGGANQVLLSSVPNTGTADTSGITVGDTLTFVVNGTTTTRSITAISDVAGSGTNAVGRLITFDGTAIATTFASFNDQTVVSVSFASAATQFTIGLIGGDYTAITSSPASGPVSHNDVPIVNGQTAQALLDRVRTALIARYGSAGLIADTAHTPAANTASIAVLTGAASTVASASFAVTDTANEMVREESVAGVAIGSTYTIVFEPTSGSSTLSGQFVLSGMTRAQVVAALSNHINSQTGWTATNNGTVINAISDASTDQDGNWEITVDNAGGSGDITFAATAVQQNGGVNIYGFGTGLTVGDDGVVDVTGGGGSSPLAGYTIQGTPDADHRFLLATGTPNVLEWSIQPTQRVDIHNLLGVDINETPIATATSDAALAAFQFTVFNALATQSVTTQVLISTGGPSYRYIRFGVTDGTIAGYNIHESIHLGVGTSTNLPFEVTNNLSPRTGDGLSGNNRQITASFRGTDAEWTAFLTQVAAQTGVMISGTPAVTSFPNNQFQTANQVVFFINADQLTVQRTVPGSDLGVLGRSTANGNYNRLNGADLNTAVMDGTFEPTKLSGANAHIHEVPTRLEDGTVGWRRPVPNIHEVIDVDLGNDQVPTTAGTLTVENTSTNFSALNLTQRGYASIDTGQGTSSTDRARRVNVIVTDNAAAQAVVRGMKISVVVGVGAANIAERTVELTVTNIADLGSTLDITGTHTGTDTDWTDFLAQVRNDAVVPANQKAESTAYGRIILIATTQLAITVPVLTSSRGQLLRVGETNGGVEAFDPGGSLLVYRGSSNEFPTNLLAGHTFEITDRPFRPLQNAAGTQLTFRLATAGTTPGTFNLNNINAAIQTSAGSNVNALYNALTGAVAAAHPTGWSIIQVVSNFDKADTVTQGIDSDRTIGAALAGVTNAATNQDLNTYSLRNNAAFWIADAPGVDTLFGDPQFFIQDPTTQNFVPLFIGADHGLARNLFLYNSPVQGVSITPFQLLSANGGTAELPVFVQEPTTVVGGFAPGLYFQALAGLAPVRIDG